MNSGSNKSNVAIIGAGIGGLTAARALQMQGVNVQLFEKAPRLMPIGAGLTLQSNAMQALERIGLDQAVKRAGALLERASFLRQDGLLISSMDMGDIANELGQPNVCIHRGVLQQVLLEAVGEHCIRKGVEVEMLENNSDDVLIELTDGTRHQFDAVIGADGLRSRTRSQMWGEMSLRPVRYTTWRGICPNVDLVEAGHAVETWGAGQRFGFLPMDDHRIYWFATESSNDQHDRLPAREYLSSRFADWHDPVPQIVKRTDVNDILHADVYDLKPFFPWGRGRITLLGDAAHAMTPNFGQGGGQAIEDAVTLAELFGKAMDVEHWLRGYERRRKKRTHQFVAESRRFGELAQGSSPLIRFLRTMLFAIMPKSIAHRRMRKMLTFST